MVLRKKANDGTVYGVYNQGNGDYVAAEDVQGYHHAPPKYVSLPSWDEAEARRQLDRAVRAHNARIGY